jgi:hypothetical protein
VPDLLKLSPASPGSRFLLGNFLYKPRFLAPSQALPASPTYGLVIVSAMQLDGRRSFPFGRGHHYGNWDFKIVGHPVPLR